MATEIQVTWIGASGAGYKYSGYLIGTPMKKVPANYIFAKKTISNLWDPVYIGETSDLQERFNSHHKEDCILKNGATHVFAHVSSFDQRIRLSEETDLRANYYTSCNDQ